MRSSASPAIALAVVIGVVACGASEPPRAAPPQRACPRIAARCDATPGLVDDAQAMQIVEQRCWACHGAHGVAGHDFVDIPALRRAPIGEMIGTCQMPPDGSALSDAERRTLLAWSACPREPIR